MRRCGGALLLAISMLAFATTGGAAASRTEVRAVLHGRAIPVSRIHHLHCHDGARPTIRCFRSEAARDRDAQRLSRSPVVGRRGGDSAAVTYYVTVWGDINYSGGSYSFSAPNTNLGWIGWNDCISSFKTVGGTHPKFWEHADYGGSAWQWAIGAWVANVGSGANDQWSSLRNVQ
jgi:hypothetical protein